MGLRGPKTKPDVVHLASGNPSKKKFAVLRDGARVPVGIPEPPPHLLDDALKEWGRITPLLLELGLIAQVDRAAIAVYCQAYARWVQAEKKIAELGDAGLVAVVAKSGYEQIGPWLQVSNRAVEQMHKFLSEFGMTPSARTRVDVSPQGDFFSAEPKPTPQQAAKNYFPG